MPASRSTDPRSPFPRPVLRLVEDEPVDLQAAPSDSPTPLRSASFEGQVNEGGCEDALIADITPVNTPIAPVTVSVPKPVPVDRHPPLIRMLTELIARIRWFPVAWQLFCAIPSETRQAWNKAFGPKQE